MHASPDDVTRLILATIIAVGFISMSLLLATHGTPSSNGVLLGHMVETSTSTFAMVVRYYFKQRL